VIDHDSSSQIYVEAGGPLQGRLQSGVLGKTVNYPIFFKLQGGFVKLITRNTDYALRAICYIAKQDKVVTVTELVKVLGVPRPFLRKILQRLSQKGILESYKGQAGGFRLKVAPRKVFIIQIMHVFQGDVELNGCFLKKHICPNKGKCLLRKKIQLIENNVFSQLKRINIASLI
jgi:Rrf2 family transcriptional regulator, iron-sulfur cluster assembly transcription factor